ncbi:MAG: hypothetical protein JNJ83_02500 [Verrucomicrobiaceae bacterium]|nr:hypothetical protein [Verrucomicrobiaceae bacterium]
MKTKFGRAAAKASPGNNTQQAKKERKKVIVIAPHNAATRKTLSRSNTSLSTTTRLTAYTIKL